MRVTVFGGRGFIGRHVTHRLSQDADLEVVVADRGEAEASAKDGCDVAVFVHGGRVDGLKEAIALHATLTEQLLWLARPSHVIFLSSGECYGSGQIPYGETQPLLGTSPYALAKIEGERRVMAYAGSTGTSYVVLRPGVVYGPGQAGSMLIPSVLRELIAGATVALTRGEQTRDFVAVEDVVTCLVTVLRAKSSGTYNVGTGIETRVRDAATAAARCLSEALGKDCLSLLAFGTKPEREHETARYALDPDHAYRTLGFRAKIPLSEGLKAMVTALLTEQSAGNVTGTRA